MTEDEAQLWLQNTFNVSRETRVKFDIFVEFLKREALTQNLISSSTVDHIWSRHIVDSAQLLCFASDSRGPWIDLGSGAGFPGLVVALLSQHHVTLVESRARRIDFLKRAIAVLDLEARVEVAGMALESLKTVPYSVISARAFAPLPRLMEVAARFSTDKTLWLLPKGRNAAKEWDDVKSLWNADFRLERSVTSNEAGILVGHVTSKPGHHSVQSARGQQTV